MSESKATLKRDIEQYKTWEAEARQRGWDQQERHSKEIADIEKMHDDSVRLHRLEYRTLAEAVKNVYGISVETLLKAHLYKIEKAEEAELQDAYTEAIEGKN